MLYWCFSNHPTGVHPDTVLSSASDVGQVRDGRQVTWADYETAEDRFVEAFRLICAVAGADVLEIDLAGVNGPLPEDFPPFHNGAGVGVAAAERLVRSGLRGQSFCALNGPDRFSVTFGHDMYLYVRSPDSVASVRPAIEETGLYVIDVDPRDDELFDGDPDIWQAPAADAGFWAQADRLRPEPGRHLLVAEHWAFGQEGRSWYAPEPGHVSDLATLVTPRSLVYVFPSVPPAGGEPTPTDEEYCLVEAEPTAASPRLTAKYHWITGANDHAAPAPGGSGYLFIDPDAGSITPRPLAAVVPDPDGTVHSRWPSDMDPDIDREG